jgi:short-subunit dehydrogenase
LIGRGGGPRGGARDDGGDMTGTGEKTIVVGASSGIGAEIAHQYAKRGGAVALLGRRADRLEAAAAKCRAAHPTARAFAHLHDVRDHASVRAAFDRCVAELGGVDRVVYASGVMSKTAPEVFDFDQDRAIVEVNVIGAMAWLDLAATRFEKEGRGQIVGVSSIAGERGRAPHPAYNASKACLTVYLEALYNRLWRKGVSVVTVKPGYIGTEMLDHVDPKKLFWVLPAERCAEIVVAAADKKRRSFYVPWRWTLVALALRSIPSFIFRRLNV